MGLFAYSIFSFLMLVKWCCAWKMEFLTALGMVLVTSEKGKVSEENNLGNKHILVHTMQDKDVELKQQQKYCKAETSQFLCSSTGTYVHNLYWLGEKLSPCFFKSIVIRKKQYNEAVMQLFAQQLLEHQLADAAVPCAFILHYKVARLCNLGQPAAVCCKACGCTQDCCMLVWLLCVDSTVWEKKAFPWGHLL